MGCNALAHQSSAVLDQFHVPAGLQNGLKAFHVRAFQDCLSQLAVQFDHFSQQHTAVEPGVVTFFTAAGLM